MSIPEDLKYTKEHEWVRVEGEEVVVGITEFAQSELGEIVFVELPEVGNTVEKGATLCVVESTKAASDVYAPVAGKISLINEELANAPDLINSEPFTGGWMVKLSEVSGDDMQALLDAKGYAAVLNE